MGYHHNKIRKGTLGEFDKIMEEFDELTDAYSQCNPVLELCEMADLIGDISQYSLKKYKIPLDDLIRMTKATESAFKDGERK